MSQAYIIYLRNAYIIYLRNTVEHLIADVSNALDSLQNFREDQEAFEDFLQQARNTLDAAAWAVSGHSAAELADELAGVLPDLDRKTIPTPNE